MPMKVETTYDGKPDGLEFLQKDFQAIGEQINDIKVAGTVIANNAALATKEKWGESRLFSRTDALRASTYAIHEKTDDGMVIGIGNPQVYAEIQDKGGPRKDTEIVPVNAKALKIPTAFGTFAGRTGKATQFIFRKKVIIPAGAIRASGFMTNPFLQSVKMQFDDLFNKILGMGQ